MFMHLVTQLSGRITALYTQALELIKVHLWLRAKLLRASFIRGFQNAVSLSILLVKTSLNFKALLAKLIPVVPSTKVAPKRAATTNGPIGKQQATTARPTRRRVSKASKKGN
jgi:hypothetical protein